jgi:hypothetical protein
VTFVHLGATPPSSLVDFVRRGGNAFSASSLDQAIHRLLRSIASERQMWRLTADDAFVELDEARLRARLVDCSSTGFAFVAPSSTPLGLMTYGSKLERIRLTRNGVAFLSGATARVRSIVTVREGFRIGCQFEQQLTKEAWGERIDDPVRVYALLQRVARRTEVFVHTNEGRMESLGSLRVDTSNGRLIAANRLALKPFDIARCETTLDDVRYEWLCTVAKTQPTELVVASPIDESVRRHPVRRRPQREAKATFTHPLTRIEHTAEIVDFSPDGVQLKLPNTTFAMPSGLLLDDVKLELGETVISARGECRHHRDRHAGVKLTFNTTRDAQAIRMAWVCADKAGVRDARPLAFEEVYSLCRKAGLISDEIAESMKPGLQQTKQTMERFSQDDGDIFTAACVVENDQPVAYSSSVRVYANTWYVQHLASVNAGLGATTTLNRAIGELCEQSPEMKFFQLAWYVDNPWPARVFGGFARRIDSGGILVVPRRYQRVRHGPGLGGSYGCRKAQPIDSLRVAAFLAQTHTPLHLQALDLDLERLGLTTLSTLYAQKGLSRSREMVLAERDGQIVGLTICELSPTGANFRELLSQARVVFSPALSESERAVVNEQLVGAACQVYSDAGRPFTVMCDAMDVSPEMRWGAPFTLMELTARRDLLKDFKRLMRLSSVVVADDAKRAE